MVDVQAQKVLQVRLFKGVRGLPALGHSRSHFSWLPAHSPAPSTHSQNRGGAGEGAAKKVPGQLVISIYCLLWAKHCARFLENSHEREVKS